MTTPLHPLCELLPVMKPADFQKLKNSIAREGQLVPITLYEGRILDGRHRERACLEIGLIPKYEEYTGHDPVGFVCAANFDRRNHQGPGQRAAFFVLAANWRKNAVAHGGARVAEKNQAATVAGLTTQAERARLAGVSLRNMQNVERLYDDDHDELLRAVALGQMSLPSALKLAYPRPLPPAEDPAPDAPSEEEQRDAVTERLEEAEEERQTLRLRVQELEQEVSLLKADPSEQVRAIELLKAEVEALKLRNAQLEEERNRGIDRMNARRAEQGRSRLHG